MDKKRQEIEKLIYDAFNILDKTGTNTKTYKAFFSHMTDKEFNSYMKNFLNNDSENFYLEIHPFVDGREPKITDIKECADMLGVPLTENMWMPFANPDGEPLRTVAPVPVGYLHMKRLIMWPSVL